MATGHCNCRSVAFEVSSRLRDVYVCHCSICRRATGTNGIAVVIVPNAEFTWIKGQEFIGSWKKPNHDWEMWFCKTCASPLPGKNDDGQMFIPAGLIESGGEAMKVAHHIWVESKASWDKIGDSGKRHKEAFKEG